MSKESMVDIKIGETSTSFSQRNAIGLKIDRQPAGLNFLELNYPQNARGKASINFGQRKLLIERVISVTGTEDMSFPEEGLSEFQINAEIAETDLIAHDDARLKMFEILRHIVQAGWKTTVPLGMARLRGKDMTNYQLRTKKFTTLDPAYVPSLEEWMAMESMTQWEFYADHIYLNVNFMRDHTLRDPSKPGAYLLTFGVMSEVEHFRRNVDGLERKRWKEILPKELRTLEQLRVDMEAAMRVKRVTVDETYVDPPVPNLANTK